MILPDRLGRYEVQSLRGLGGMGAVYKARDPVLDRVVALKTISPLLLSSVELQEEYLERFRREAQAAGRLSHPNIVSVYDMGLDEPTATPFIVMEYVAGVTLETVLKENPTLPIAQGLELIGQVASALEEAHRNGVVHRDIKPANIFLDVRGRVKVGDFGVARLEGSELTQAGLGLGTPGYLAPEVVRGGVADARSDVFALGVLAYRVLSGVRPFEGATRETLAVEVFQRQPPPPHAVRGEIPEHVSSAVMRALEKSPDARTPSAEAFLSELQASAELAPTVEPTGSTIRVADPVAAPPPAGPRSRGLRRGLMAALIAALLVLGAFLAGRGLGRREPPTASAPELPPATVGAAPVPAPPRPTAPPPRAARPSPRASPTAEPAGDEPAADSLDPSDILGELARRGEEKLREELRKREEKRREQDKKRPREKKGREKDRDRQE